MMVKRTKRLVMSYEALRSIPTWMDSLDSGTPSLVMAKTTVAEDTPTPKSTRYWEAERLVAPELTVKSPGSWAVPESEKVSEKAESEVDLSKMAVNCEPDPSD